MQQYLEEPSGWTVKEEDMNTNASTASQAGQKSAVSAIILSAVIGLGLIFVTGHVQAETLHDGAHDVRHATGFPCH